MNSETQNYVPTASSVAELRERIGKIAYWVSGCDEVLIVVQRRRETSGKLVGYIVETWITGAVAHVEPPLKHPFRTNEETFFKMEDKREQRMPGGYEAIISLLRRLARVFRMRGHPAEI